MKENYLILIIAFLALSIIIMLGQVRSVQESNSSYLTDEELADPNY